MRLLTFGVLLIASWMGLSVAAAAQPVPAQVAVAPLIPIADFARLPLMSNPTLSPNGEYVAAIMAVKGEKLFMVFKLSDASAPLAQFAIPDTLGLDSFVWVNNDWLLAGVSTTQKIAESPIPLRIRRQIAVSRDGKSVQILNRTSGGYEDRVVHVPKDGSTRILMSTSNSIFENEEGRWPRVAEFDVASGKQIGTRVPGAENVRDWYADSAGVVRLGYGFDYATNRSKLIYRAKVGEPFKPIDRADRNKYETLISPVLFDADPNKLIVQHSVNGKEGLYEYDTAAGKMGKKIYESQVAEIEDVILSPDGKSVAGVMYVDDVAHIDWLDPKLKEMQAALDKSVPGKTVNIVSYDQAQENFIVRIGSPRDPGRYYLFSTADGTLHFYARVHEEMKDHVLASMTPVKYKARDGLEIPGYLTLPVGRGDKNLPLIVLPHGGPAARDTLGYDDDVQFLANRGYAVLQPNFRGSAGYGADYAEKADGQWGLTMQDDITDGVKWLIASGVADPKRVCIMGGSYGGYAAMTGIFRDPDLYRCAISFAGISDLPRLLRYDSNFLYYKAQKKSLKSGGADLNVVSAINNIAKIKTPLLLIHGKKDLRVPVEQSTIMAKAMQAAGKPVELVLQPEGDHHLSREADRLSYFTAIADFLEKYNPAK